MVEDPAGRDAILRLLSATRLPAFECNGLTLPEALMMLQADAKRYDPAKQGVRFAKRNAPTNAQPATDLDTVIVMLTPPLRDVSVLGVLNAIVAAADQPIGFTVETNRVVFHPREADQPATAPQRATAAPGARLRAKAEKIILLTVQYDGLPLPEVLRMLSDDAKINDPAKRGVNLVAQPPSSASGPQLDTVIIRVADALKNLTLPQTLDIICAAADQPIAYRFEDYAIYIHPRPAAAGATERATQSYGVRPERLLAALARELGRDPNRLPTHAFTQNDWLAEYLGPRGFAVPPGSPPVFRLADRIVSYSGPRAQANNFATLLYGLERSAPAAAKPVSPAPVPVVAPAKPADPAKARAHCDRLEAFVKTLRGNPASTVRDYAAVAGLIEQALADYAAVLRPDAPELARLRKLLAELRPAAP